MPLSTEKRDRLADITAEWLARRLYRRLKRNDPDAYLGRLDETDPGFRVVIDGKFNLLSIATKLLRDISEAPKSRKEIRE